MGLIKYHAHHILFVLKPHWGMIRSGVKSLFSTITFLGFKSFLYCVHGQRDGNGFIHPRNPRICSILS